MTRRLEEFLMVRTHATRSALLALILAAGTTPAWAQDAGVARSAPAKKTSVGENVKNLGRELTDPNTPKRIKAHEQEAEQRIERTRDQQRQDHGKATPGDMVDVVKKMDGPDAGNSKAGANKPPVGQTHTKTQVKVETTETKTTHTTTTGGTGGKNGGVR